MAEALPPRSKRYVNRKFGPCPPLGGQRNGLRSLRTCSNSSGNVADDAAFQWSSIARIALLYCSE